jgi:hypothetical protein
MALDTILLQEITIDDVQRLVDQDIREDRRLDYKQALPTGACQHLSARASGAGA